MHTLLKRFAKDESGATAIEYGLIATLIGVAIIVGAGALGTNLNGIFNYIAGKLATPGT
jgi:pilus assembly protein Flp/PilA